MRYVVMLKGISLQEAMSRCADVGARDISPKPLTGQLFCELEPDQVAKLNRMPGMIVKPVSKTGIGQVVRAPAGAVQALQGLNLYDTFNALRVAYSPMLDGTGLTVAVLDSGIRETHESLVGKIVYSENFSSSPTEDDVFGHGTGVAYVIAGQKGSKSGVATGASLMNLKVLDDDGEGTDEMLVDAVEKVCSMVKEARENNVHPTDPSYPNTINLSIGSPDDGDSDNPMRVACRAAVRDYGLQVIAAAGNGGPTLTSIFAPATDPDVIAVGGLKTWEFLIWEQSSRGPTKQGLIKPDIVCWAEGIEVASEDSDIGYVQKSGTSFSTPIITGVDGILWDLTRRVYGQDVRILISEWLQYASAYCIKPSEAPVAKDNSYGYGLPAVGSMVNRVIQPVAPIATLQNVIPIMMMMGMMPAIMGGI